MKTFGELVEGYHIPVLNEREIRAAAGIMFLATFISLMLIINSGNFVPIKYVIIVFLIDFSIRLFINPKYAPVLILGRFMVSNQNPEYVGAKQKKFAWYIGLFLAAAMFILMVVFNTYSIITGLVCLICLILMFFESAFGICIGCKMYSLFYKEKAQYCPGEICDVKTKHDIQKINLKQVSITFLFIAFIFLITFLFSSHLFDQPVDLFKANTINSTH